MCWLPLWFLVGARWSLYIYSFFFFFSCIWWLTATVSLNPSRAQACWPQCCSSSSLCGEDVFSKSMYAGHIHPTWLPLAKQSCPLCLIYTVETLFPCYTVSGRQNVLPLQIWLIEVLVEALLWFINTAAQVSALTTAGGNILLCNTNLRFL